MTNNNRPPTLPLIRTKRAEAAYTEKLDNYLAERQLAGYYRERNSGLVDGRSPLDLMDGDASLANAVREHMLRAEATGDGNGKGPLEKVVEAVAGNLVADLRTYFVNQDDLAKIQKACVDRFDTDPMIGAAGEIVQQYTIGSGIRFSVGNEQVDKYLDTVWGANVTNMEAKQSQIALMLYLCAEYFAAYVYESEGDRDKITVNGVEVPNVSVFGIHPWDVKDIITDVKRREDVIAVATADERKDVDKFDLYYASLEAWFKETYAENILLTNYHSGKSEVQPEQGIIVHYMRGHRGAYLRGAPLPRRALKWARLLQEVVLDAISKNHEWAKVLWKLKLLSKNARVATSTANKAPSGAQVLIETPESAWDVMETRMDKDGMQAVFYMAAAYTSGALRVPYQAILYDFSQSDYASSRQGEKPFHQFIADHRVHCQRAFRDFFRFMIDLGIRRECLPAKTKVRKVSEQAVVMHLDQALGILRDSDDQYGREAGLQRLFEDLSTEEEVDTTSLNVHIMFPETAGETLLNRARAIELYDRAGVASKQTLAELGGFHWPTETSRMMDYAMFRAKLSAMLLSAEDGGDVPDLMPDSRERGKGDDHPRPDEGDGGGEDKYGDTDDPEQ